MSAAKASPVTLVRKITPKVIMAGRPELIGGKKTDLYSIAGIARRCETVQTNYGDSVRFIGDFIAVNLQTGEVTRSNRGFFPKLVQDELESAVKGTGNVEFAMKVSILPDEKSATGYVYHMESLQKPQENDAVSALAEKIGVNLKLEANPATAQKSLPAPTGKQTEKADDKGKGKK